MQALSSIGSVVINYARESSITSWQFNNSSPCVRKFNGRDHKNFTIVSPIACVFNGVNRKKFTERLPETLTGDRFSHLFTFAENLN